jgi:transcriptional regulator with XRE-family HTH domain
MTGIGKKLTAIRKKKGLTQEEVSELAKINLRTLQRIEKDETEPRGSSLNGICKALGIDIAEILDDGKIQDNSYLIYLHISVLLGLFVPAGTIILPFTLWLNKRESILLVGRHGSNIINFQILWTVILYLGIFFFFYLKMMHIYAFPSRVLWVFILTLFVYC